MNQREQVSLDILDMLKERASNFFIIIDDVSITHLTFSQDFLTSVEAKQSAQQDAERAKYLVQQSIQNKKSTIVKAEGEAIAAELIGIEMNPAYLELKRVEAAMNIAEIIAKSKCRSFLDNETLLLNLSKPIARKLLNLGGKKSK